MRGKLKFVIGAAAGFVLGARSGRQSYEKIKARATDFWNSPRVKEAVTGISDNAKEAASGIADTAKKTAGAAQDRFKKTSKKDAAATDSEGFPFTADDTHPKDGYGPAI